MEIYGYIGIGILALLYLLAFHILHPQKAKALLKSNLIITGANLILIGGLLLFPDQDFYIVKNPEICLGLSLLQFIVLFIPFYYIRLIKFKLFGHELQNTIRKLLILFCIPLDIMLYFKNDLSFLKPSSFNPLILLIVAFWVVSSYYTWIRVYNFRLFFKVIGWQRFLSQFLLILFIQAFHVGITEEFFFRVLIFGSLNPLVGKFLAVLISSLFFGLEHIFFLNRNTGMVINFSQVITYHTSLGLFITVAWIKCANIYLLLLAHISLNSLYLSSVYSIKKYYKQKRQQK